MMKALCSVLLVCSALGLATASRVRTKCDSDGALVENDDIQLTACTKIPCKLVRGSRVGVEMKFTPVKDVATMTNSVYAKILGVPFPFIGVNGNSVCDKIFDASGAKSGCPLKAGTSYVYKDSFPVLEEYPKIKVWVRWALIDDHGDDKLCFEVPVKITSS